MTLTILWNGGQNAATFRPSTKLMCAILAIFLCGVLFIGILAAFILYGVGLALWNGGGILLHLLATIATNDLFLQVFALLLLGFLLVVLIGFLIRYLASSVRGVKGV